jgi:uncharacterized membrane protein YvbJ
VKACVYCGQSYADAQEACPHCGRKPGDPQGELRRVQDLVLDEGFGPLRRKQLLQVIVIVLIFTIVAAISWFW